jgi:hypothetical protein
MNGITSILGRMLLIALLIQPVTLSAQSATETTANSSAGQSVVVQNPIDRLGELRQQVADSRQQMADLKKRLKSAREEELKQQLQRQLDELPLKIDQLNRAFDQIAIGSIDMSLFNNAPEETFDWKAELLQITKPLFSSLKDLTEKPRKLEQVRGEIVRHQRQLEQIDRAQGSITAILQSDGMQDGVRDRLVRLQEEWQQRQVEKQNALELLNYQLATLQGQNVSLWTTIGETVDHFLQGRGLTLLIALLAIFAVWLVARLLLRLVQRWKQSLGAGSGREQLRWNRVVAYIYRLFTLVLGVVAVIIVFYTRGDLLLLALTILGLFMAVVSLRQTIPRYIEEIRLLLDFGGVREGERVIWNGIPMEVKTIRTFAVLQNPLLEGLVRLPLGRLTELTSRPLSNDLWFPCSGGDYVLFDDGRTAQVIRQTVELVEIRQAGSNTLMATSDFLAASPRNLSRGFSQRIQFGIDYQHQAICLDSVPELLKESVRSGLRHHGLGGMVKDVIVDFTEAAASSLDYLIYVDFEGRAAEHYWWIKRILSQSAVAACNQYGWSIPFTQVTIHNAAVEPESLDGSGEMVVRTG